MSLTCNGPRTVIFIPSGLFCRLFYIQEQLVEVGLRVDAGLLNSTKVSAIRLHLSLEFPFAALLSLLTALLGLLRLTTTGVLGSVFALALHLVNCAL
jgi:hypothetical protein